MRDVHMIPGIWKIDGYTKISNTIKKKFDVTERKNFFQFPYDWRRHNKASARKLLKESHTWLENWKASQW